MPQHYNILENTIFVCERYSESKAILVNKSTQKRFLFIQKFPKRTQSFQFDQKTNLCYICNLTVCVMWPKTLLKTKKKKFKLLR